MKFKNFGLRVNRSFAGGVLLKSYRQKNSWQGAHLLYR